MKSSFSSVCSLIALIMVPWYGQGQDFQYAILEGDSMFYNMREATGYKASDNDVIQSEKILRDCIISIEQQYATLKTINMNQYIRQYIGYKTVNGDKYLWVNGLCYVPDDEEIPDWRTEVIEIVKGGDCYFHVEINLDLGQCENINVHGW